MYKSTNTKFAYFLLNGLSRRTTALHFDAVAINNLRTDTRLTHLLFLKFQQNFEHLLCHRYYGAI